MRIRIVRNLPIRDVDGIALDAFEVGMEYDVGSRMEALLLAEGWAEPVAAGPVRAAVPRPKREAAADQARKAVRRRR
jgi:hypothetical protein